MARDDFAELAANSEPGSMFDLLNQLGQALDRHDELSRTDSKLPDKEAN